ncbi:hypothetical protein IJE86_09500 [bacterium]|nr:hypothetical protein [bacterium]
MRKLIITLLGIFLSTQSVLAAKDYEKLYNEAEVPKIKLMHNLDPYQNEDYYNYTWAPYPLFRTATALYFKDITIPPGYYLLAARTIKDKDYIFFKESGKVKFIIPVIETDIVLEDSYQRKMPTPKLTKTENVKKKIASFFKNHMSNSKKQDPPSSFIQAQKLDENFHEIIYYYGNKKYTMYFRTSSF